MSISTFAFVIAAVELLAGLPMLVSPSASAEILKRMMKEDLLYRFVGAFFFVLCVMTLNIEYTVSLDLAGIMRLMAWWGGFKCLMICWWPGKIVPIGEAMLSNPTRQRLSGLLATVAGILFAWAGVLLR